MLWLFRLLEVFEDDRAVYLVSEFCPGEVSVLTSLAATQTILLDAV